jgi:N6-L-threonylcarbamoyladenine synthase
MEYLHKMQEKIKEIKGKEKITILALETSCDETSVAIVQNGRCVISNKIASQIPLHKVYGGVVPEIASRKHVEVINPLIDEALKEANMGFEDMDAVAVAHGPGLVGALLVGVSTAKALAYGLSVPLIGVNHIDGHISANYIENRDLVPPFLCLVVSGGHTYLIMVKDYGKYEILGETRDDAAGEAYDKVARALGLEYPGGPIIDRLAKEGDSTAVHFPRVYMDDNPYDFSFSGLKTAVINHIHNLGQKGEVYNIKDIAASFQQAVIDVLVDKTMLAAQNNSISKIAIAGGVASNAGLRRLMKDRADALGIKLYYPSPIFCTDNAAMVGCAAYYNLLKDKISDLKLNAYPNLEL